MADAYYARNKEKVKADVARWQAANPDKVKGYLRKAYEAHKDKYMASRNARRTTDPERYVNAPARRRESEKRALVNWFKDQPCMDCSNKFPVECMDLDHVFGVKVKAVSGMLSGGLDALLEEIVKCEVVCANCHRIRTMRRKRGQ